MLSLLPLLFALPPGQHRMDARMPKQPPVAADSITGRSRRQRALGDPHTVFVNFDGIKLGECNPSDSHRNCSWYNFNVEIPEFSGSLQTRVGILQAMRNDAADLGLRITAARPDDDDDYTMVVYGGEELDFGALGSAPSGDCENRNPNQIAFAHVDGDLSNWINGGATTALHEAAHSWGLDHIDIEGSIMFPSGDNSPTLFRDECDVVVENTDLDPGVGSCAELNRRFCDDPDRQNAKQMLQYVFGPPYVDSQAPQIELSEPEDGQYFQAPADFEVVIDTFDDQHPQAYSMWAWLDDEGRPDTSQATGAPGFVVSELPVGTWNFHVVVADEAGNESRLDFEIEVGLDPPPDPEEDGCGCTADGVSGSGALVWLLLPLLARRRQSR